MKIIQARPYKRGADVDVLVDDDVYVELSQHTWKQDEDGYIYRRVYVGQRNGRSLYRDLYLHRYLLGLTKGDGILCDHRNRIRTDCQRHNLRKATPALNAQNRSATREGLPRGVQPVTRKFGLVRFTSAVTLDGSRKYLGTFDTPEAAGEVARQRRLVVMPFSEESIAA